MTMVAATMGGVMDGIEDNADKIRRGWPVRGDRLDTCPPHSSLTSPCRVERNRNRRSFWSPSSRPAVSPRAPLWLLHSIFPLLSPPLRVIPAPPYGPYFSLPDGTQPQPQELSVSFFSAGCFTSGAPLASSQHFPICNHPLSIEVSAY